LHDSNIPLRYYTHEFTVTNQVLKENLDAYQGRILSVNDYKHNIGGSPNALVFLGEDVALILDNLCEFKFSDLMEINLYLQ